MSEAHRPTLGMDLAQALVGTLPSGRPGLFNPWKDHCELDTACNGPTDKIRRLAQHLDVVPSLILCGEAAGYQGKRHSGLAFTSERLILDGVIPRVETDGRRLTHRRLPYSEPSATIVWKTLYRLHVAEETVMWNALPMHPFRPNEPHSNRTPSDDELALGRVALEMLVAAFPQARLVAVGKKAEFLIGQLGTPLSGSVRHPANGGATEFANGLARLLRR